MKRVIILLPLVIYSSFSFASEQDKLTKWNNPVSKEIRQAHADKLAQTTYREINVKDARVSDDISKVYPQIETKVTKDGSATRVVAEAVLNTDKEKVAKDWAKKLNTAAKFGTGVLGSAALGLMVNELLHAIDYVMGEGGEIRRKNVNPDDPYHQYYYQASTSAISNYDSKTKFSSFTEACQFFDNKKTTYSGTLKYVRTQLESHTFATCWYQPSIYTDGYTNTYVSVHRITNPSYNPAAPSPIAPATETEIKDAIKTKVLDKASTDSTARNLAKKLVKDSYARIWDDKGNSLEIRGDVSNKQKDIVSSDNPANDGHSTSTPTISDGKSGSGSSSSDSSSSGTTEGTTFNPDGSVASSSVTTTTTTTTSTTNIEFELPAFCDWASTVCEWLDWTKKDDDLPAKDQSDLNVEVPFEEKNVSVSWGAQCPAPTYETVSLHGVTAQIKTTDFTYICDLDWLIKPFVIGFASISALFILFGFQRGGDD
ncbi:virulence factor TspB C-terminal domain-related protein [Acinetobacter sp. YH16032]|uniref:virulence factor TspB C-terminal domain-related protein n=1 Tax=Acinetobacter sp. YH16032 TaxID=2601181 RepID=UPI0015D1B06A|nr:virulence factor TspB C-terminal domain-related protein [Acinetobacter sp. YH16032]